MKRILFVLTLALLCPLALMAQTTDVVSEVTVDVTTFTGMAAFVSMILTQIVKKVPAIGATKVATVATSAVLGIAVTMVCWWLGVAEFVADYNWWQTLLAGLTAGLGSSGLYDFLRGIYQAFGGKDDTTEETETES